IGSPAAAHDDHPDAVEKPHQWQACERRRIFEGTVGERTPRPARRNSVLCRWVKTVSGRMAEFERQWNGVWRDPVENRAIAPAKVRAVGTLAVNQKVQKPADARLAGDE